MKKIILLLLISVTSLVANSQSQRFIRYYPNGDEAAPLLSVNGEGWIDGYIAEYPYPNDSVINVRMFEHDFEQSFGVAWDVPYGVQSSGNDYWLDGDVIGTETDPTIYSWAKASAKPSYAWSEIASKPTFATVATSGDYNDLSNKPTIPTAKRTETYIGTTNSSGEYTVTFGTAFSSTPNIQAISITSNAGQVCMVTSVSTTGFTVKVVQRSAVTLLGVEVLLAATTNVNGATAHVLVTQN